MDTVIYVSLVFIVFITLYPFYYTLVLSFNNGIDTSRGGVYFWPRVFTLENYIQVFKDPAWGRASFISVSRTVIGTACTLIFSGLFAYGLSFDNLRFRKIYMSILLFSMYFSGGLIPYFVLLRALGLLNSFAVYIIPLLMDSFMVLIMIAFFKEIPRSLHESAKIDGANDLIIFFRIILPTSKPVVATASLFMGVHQWNSWFDALLYVTKDHMRPLQMILQLILRETQIENILQIHSLTQRQSRRINPESYKMAVLIVTTVPIVFVYPFAQKYFVKGIMMGSVKL